MGFDYLLPFSFVLGAFDRRAKKEMLKENSPPIVPPTPPVDVPLPPVEPPAMPSESPSMPIDHPPENWCKNTRKRVAGFNQDMTGVQLDQIVSGIWANLSEKSRRVIWARYEGQARRRKPKEDKHEQTP